MPLVICCIGIPVLLSSVTLLLPILVIQMFPGASIAIADASLMPPPEKGDAQKTPPMLVKADTAVPWFATHALPPASIAIADG